MVKELQEMQRELRENLEGIQKQLAKIAKPETTQTPSKAAEERRQGIKEESFPGTDDGGLLSKTVLQALKQNMSDSHKVNLIMEREVLGRILPKHVLLVNCETYPLADGVGQPDFFGACCYSVREPPKNKPKESARYGVPARLDSVTALFDGKTKRTMNGAAEDQMFRQLNATSASYGLLYTGEVFRLLIASGETFHKRLTRIVNGSWATRGVVKFLAKECEEYQPLHELRLQACLEDSKTKMMEHLGEGRVWQGIQSEAGEQTLCHESGGQRGEAQE